MAARKLLIFARTAAITAAAVPMLPLFWSKDVSIPRVLLGTGGGNGGYDAAAWLAAGGPGFDSAYTYCYNTNAPYWRVIMR